MLIENRRTEISLLRSIWLNSDKTPTLNKCSKQDKSCWVLWKIIQLYKIIYRAISRHSGIQNSSILAIFLMLFPLHHCLFFTRSSTFAASLPRQQKQQHERWFLGITAPYGYYFYGCKCGPLFSKSK